MSSASLRSPEINPLNLWNSLRTELLWVYEGGIHSSNRHRESDHTHGYWVWLLERGSVKATSGTGALHAKKGQWLVSPHQVIFQDFSDDAIILSLHFACQWPTGDNLFAGREGLVFDSEQYPQLAVAARKLLALVQTGFPATDVHFAHQPARYSEFLELQQLFHRWLDAFVGIMENEGRIFMHIGSIDDRLMKAVRALKETPLEAPFPTEILQRETGLGRAHLDRLFYQSFGTTTRGYWDQRRLESARTILGTTRMPVKEMSFRLGFKQASHFTKWFQRLAGSTPISYRKTEYKPGARASASKPKTEGKSPTRSVRGGSVKRAPSRFQSK